MTMLTVMSVDNIKFLSFLSQLDFLPVVLEVALDPEAFLQGEGVTLGSTQEDVHHEKVASQEQDVSAFPYGLVLQNNKKTKTENRLIM